jgi:hypothetical protein
MTAGDQHFLKSYIGASSAFYEHAAEGVHRWIFWACIIAIVVTFVFMIYNRGIQ